LRICPIAVLYFAVKRSVFNIENFFGLVFPVTEVSRKSLQPKNLTVARSDFGVRGPDFQRVGVRAQLSPHLVARDEPF